MAEENIFSQQTQLLIGNRINERIPPEEYRVIKQNGDALALRTAAANFEAAQASYLRRCENTVALCENETKIIAAREQAAISGNTSQLEQLLQDNLYYSYQKEKEKNYSNVIARAYYKELIAFWHAINSFLGQKMILTLVSEEGNIYYIKEDSYQQVLSYSKEGPFFSAKLSKDVNSLINSLNKTEYEELNIQNLITESPSQTKIALQRVNWARASCLVRLNIARKFANKANTTKSNNEKKDFGGVILWRSPKRGTPWYGIVANAGEVGEAYAYIILARKENYFILPFANQNLSIEQILDIFIFDFLYPNVDNTSGVSNGDISLNYDHQRLEMAIKTNGATLISVSQFQQYLDIINNTNDTKLLQALQTRQSQDIASKKLITKFVEDATDYMSPKVLQYVYDEIDKIKI